MPLQFEWDEAKAKANVKKHKVSFDEASSVFSNTLAKIFFDPQHSHDEVREIIVGESARGRVLLVSFTDRGTGLVRIISARVATKAERSAYEESEGG